MNRAFLMAVIAMTLLAAAAISTRKADGADGGEPPSNASAARATLVEQANLWEPRQEIPSGLLEYHKSRSGGPTYLRNPEESASVISGITNAPLLVELAFDPRTDERVFAQTVERALHLAGPQRFFDDVGRRYQEKPEWLLFPRHKRLFTEANQRHVVVDAIFIGESDMPVREGFEALRHIVNDLQSGKSWDDAFREYSSRLRTEVHMGALLLGAKEKPLTMSKVARFGPAVLSERSGSEETFISDQLPFEHRATLLKGALGELFLIQDPSRRRVVLYRIGEVYLPQKGQIR